MARSKKSWLKRKLHLSHHRHTGHRLHHRHTSSGVLAAILIFVGGLMLYGNSIVSAASLTMDGAVSLGGVMPPTVENSPPAPEAPAGATNQCTEGCVIKPHGLRIVGDYGLARAVLWGLFASTVFLYMIHWLISRGRLYPHWFSLWKTWHHSK